ncbi:MAG: ABC transporter ATP-binding protein [Dongiaceae bacterium]
MGSDVGRTSRAGRTEIIRFEGVGKSFSTRAGIFEAVRNISLKVEEGEFVTLVGPSGCGKSTLLNITAGIYQPTQGRAVYRGQPVMPYNKHVGYMTQSDHLLPWRDVAGNIAVPLEINNTPRQKMRARIEELIAFVGLDGFAKSYPSQLSGGMRKRTVLARLLAYDPETLLLDEPFAALDAQLRLRLQVELTQIARKLNKTVLFVTHDLDEAVALADRCAIFTGRPGTIKRVIDIPLPRDRDLMRLRYNSDYMAVTAQLWDELALEITDQRRT